MDISSQIGNLLQWIQYIDTEVNRVTGITEQRMGAIGTRDAVANVEASRVSSSLVTEIWFNTFERGVIDLYEIIVEASKENIGKDVKLQAVLDDYSYSILENNVDYKYAEIGIFPIKSRKFARLRQVIEQIAMNAVPNGQMTQSELFNLFRSSSIFDMMDKQERIERENKRKAEDRYKQEQEALAQAQQAQAAAMMEAKQVDFNHQLEMEKAKGDIQIAMEQMKAEARLKEVALVTAAKHDSDGDGIEDTVEVLKARMEMESRKAERDLKAREIEANNEIKKAELRLKEKELEVRIKESQAKKSDK
jgi:hypothetical protein